MLALAAARLGLKTHIYCEESGPAFDVATHTSKGAFDDEAALADFAASVAVRHLRVRERGGRDGPSSGCASCRCGQARGRSRWRRIGSPRRSSCAALGIPVAPFRAVDGPAGLGAALAATGNGPSILKTRRLGYDGKGQASIAPGRMTPQRLGSSRSQALQSWSGASRFALEMSVLVVRSASGAFAFYDCPAQHARGRHPAPLDGAVGAADRRPWARPRDRSRHCRRARLCRRAGRRDVLPRRRRAGGRAADGQRDRAARAQLRPLDHRGLRGQPVREPHPRRCRLAAGVHRAALATPRWST